jgi:hypothetical protein
VTLGESENDDALQRLLDLAAAKGLRRATDSERQYMDPRHLYQAVTVSGKYHGPLFVKIEDEDA